MAGMWLPTLAGLARMVPIRDDDNPTLVGANWTADAFTVPAGRVLALDWADLRYVFGTAPVLLIITIVGAGAGGTARVRLEAPPAVNVGVQLTNTVWLEESAILRFSILNGDNTTNMDWAFAGRLFDWVDVT